MAEKQIKDVIHDNRKRMGLTQEELAERLNVSNKTISKWETGKSYPDILLVPAITKELGISINQFFDCEDPKPEAISKSNKEKLSKMRSNIILAFCLLFFAPVLAIVPTMLLQTIEVAIFCWISGVVLLLASIALVILENSKIKYLSFRLSDKQPVISLKNLTGIYCFVWYSIMFILTFLLRDLFDNNSLVAIASIAIYIAFSLFMLSVLNSYKIEIKTVKNVVLLIVSLLVLVLGIVLIIIYGVFPWCLWLLLSQIINAIILLSSNSNSNQIKENL